MKLRSNHVIPSLRDTKCRGNPFFSFSFYFAKSKAFATIFLEQARKKQRTCHAVVSSLRDTLVFLFCSGVAGLVVVVYNNNFKQVLTLYPRKIKNTSATQMRGFKDCILLHYCDTSCLSNQKISFWIASLRSQ
jgi:hypothetical protein